MSRYRSDPEFRESVRASNRKTARRYFGVGNKSPALELKQRLIERHTYGSTREYLNKHKKVETGITYTVAEMTRLLGRSVKTFSLWIATERFPKPTKVTYTKKERFHEALYTDEEAATLLTILIEHYEHKFQLSVDDIETRKKLLTTVYGVGAVITVAY